MLKLIVYVKLDHIESGRIIEDMAKYHDIYKFVCDGITQKKGQFRDIVMIMVNIIIN